MHLDCITIELQVEESGGLACKSVPLLRVPPRRMDVTPLDSEDHTHITFPIAQWWNYRFLIHGVFTKGKELAPML